MHHRICCRHPASGLWKTIPEGPREGCLLQAPEIAGCGSPHETRPQTAAEGSLEACLRPLQTVSSAKGRGPATEPSVSPRAGLAEGRAEVCPLPRPLKPPVPDSTYMNTQPGAQSVSRVLEAVLGDEGCCPSLRWGGEDQAGGLMPVPKAQSCPPLGFQDVA